MHSISTLRIFLGFVLLLLASALQAQQYYVIIGSFNNESNAQKLTGYVRSNNYNAHYDSDSGRKLYYVYVLKTTQKDEAYSQARRLQAESEFKDAWVLFGMLNKDKNSPPIEPIAEVKKEEVKEQPEEVSEQPIETKKEPDPVVTENPPTVTSTPPDPKMVVKGKLFKFVIQAHDGKIIPGSVHHVDYARGRDLASFKAGEYLDVLPPPTTNNPMTIVCAVFGYKEVVKEIDYSKPGETTGVMPDENGAWVVSYNLEPLNLGDVSVMYRVAFYKDAVVMLPPAKEELDQLVYMMTSNPNYRIKIHGHCNGNKGRRIIALGPTKNYFEMKGSDERTGTAKELSRLRAEAVQMYLTDHGIDKSRTEIYAWGGLNMLAGETSTSAKLNDRIEIEILAD